MTVRRSSERSLDGRAVEDLIAFELRWYRHGGGRGSDITDQFAMGSNEFFATILGHLEQQSGAPLRREVVDGMKAVARRRLWVGRYCETR